MCLIIIEHLELLIILELKFLHFIEVQSSILIILVKFLSFLLNEDFVSKLVLSKL